jgi:hypothetical protein
LGDIFQKNDKNYRPIVEISPNLSHTECCATIVIGSRLGKSDLLASGLSFEGKCQKQLLFSLKVMPETISCLMKMNKNVVSFILLFQTFKEYIL